MSENLRAILLAQAEITSISARKDKSIRFSVETGELTDEHRAAFFNVQGINVRMLVEPNDAEAGPPIEVKSEKEQKTCSQRLRGALYVFWQQSGSPGDFEVFYRSKMENLIRDVTKRLDQ